MRVRLPRVLELLELHRPDVVCPQETRCAAGGFPGVELSGAGYVAVHHSAGQWAGVALLAREQLKLSDPLYTWWDYRAGHFHRGLGLRIDLALLSEDLAARLSGCGIDRNFRKGAPSPPIMRRC